VTYIRGVPRFATKCNSGGVKIGQKLRDAFYTLLLLSPRGHPWGVNYYRLHFLSFSL